MRNATSLVIAASLVTCLTVASWAAPQPQIQVPAVLKGVKVFTHDAAKPMATKSVALTKFASVVGPQFPQTLSSQQGSSAKFTLNPITPVKAGVAALSFLQPDVVLANFDTTSNVVLNAGSTVQIHINGQAAGAFFIELALRIVKPSAACQVVVQGPSGDKQSYACISLQHDPHETFLPFAYAGVAGNHTLTFNVQVLNADKPEFHRVTIAPVL